MSIMKTGKYMLMGIISNDGFKDWILLFFLITFMRKHSFIKQILLL